MLNEEQKRWIIGLFSNYLGNVENFNFNYSIIHGDFDPSNFLVDPRDLKVKAIVDFEDSRVYDRAADFLFFDEGKEFLHTIMTSYKGFLDGNFEERMKFYYKQSFLGYITYGINNDLPDLLNQGLELLKKRMDRFPSI